MEKAKVGLIVCAILVIILLLSNAWFYVTLMDEIHTLHNEKNSLQSQVNTLHNEKNSFQAQVNTLQSKVNRYESILDIQEQRVILSDCVINQGAGESTLLISFNCSYAGYLKISVTSTTTNCYVTVQFWFEERLFSSQMTLGTHGEEYFLVLPTESITVYIGNTNWFSGATHTASIVYCY